MFANSKHLSPRHPIMSELYPVVCAWCGYSTIEGTSGICEDCEASHFPPRNRDVGQHIEDDIRTGAFEYE